MPNFTRSALHILSLSTLAILLWVTWSALYGPNRLTGRIPTHFGIDGAPNAWGDPKMLLMLPAVAAFLYLIMTVAGRFPNAFNYPVRVTPLNRPRLQRIALNMIAWLTLETVSLFTALQYFIVQGIRTQHNTLPPALMLMAIVVIFFTMAIHISAMRRVG